MKIAIVGSRTFNNYKLLESTIYKKMGISKIDLVVSGGAKGTDLLAEEFANKNNILTQIFLAEWDKYGKSAGYIRNQLIIRDADIVFAFWDGKSKGTKHSIDLAVKMKKKLYIIYI